MPLAVQEALLTPRHLTTCLKLSTILQMPQEAVIFHPNQRSSGVPGAPRTAAPTSIQLPTARCCKTPTPMTNGRSSTNTRCATVALSKAITGNSAPTKSKSAAPSAVIHTIHTWAPADNLALNVSLAFRDTRYSHIRLAARAPYYSATANLVNLSKD